jgi:hypothetical protein
MFEVGCLSFRGEVTAVKLSHLVTTVWTAGSRFAYKESGEDVEEVL